MIIFFELSARGVRISCKNKSPTRFCRIDVWQKCPEAIKAQHISAVCPGISILYLINTEMMPSLVYFRASSYSVVQNPIYQNARVNGFRIFNKSWFESEPQALLVIMIMFAWNLDCPLDLKGMTVRKHGDLESGWQMASSRSFICYSIIFLMFNWHQFGRPGPRLVICKSRDAEYHPSPKCDTIFSHTRVVFG